jgi:hypothetical protein
MTHQDPDSPGPQDSGADLPLEDQRIAHVDPSVPRAKTEALVGERGPIQAPQQVLSDVQPSLEALYRDRLKSIWAAAHSEVEESEREREVFFEAMLRVVESAPLVPAEVTRRAGDAGEALLGETRESFGRDLSTVALLVADLARQPLGPQELAAVIRERLAPTMTDLERAEQGTPEQRVDIIVRVLSALEGSQSAAVLASELLRYLQTQAPGLVGQGFYVTVASLAGIVGAAEGRHAQASFMYHLVLNGLRSLVQREGELEDLSREAVTVSSFNTAAIISELLQRQLQGAQGREDLSARAVRVLRDLKAISAAAATPADIAEAEAPELVQALGFSTTDPAEFLTALLDLGNAARASHDTPIGTARLEAASGVVDAARPRPQNPAVGLFNAGVSLLREEDARRAVPLITTRLLLNALGLRLAFHVTDELTVALLDRKGLDCAVNLAGACVDYWRAGGPELEGLEPLLRQLVNLTRWPPLRTRRPDVVADLSRLGTSAENLRLVPQEQAGFPELPRLLEDAIEGLRGATDGPPRVEDLVLDTARLVGHVFDRILPTEASEDLQGAVDSAVVDRRQPAQVLVERYEDYAGRPGDPVGVGPLVAAGVMDLSEWRRLASQLLDPIPTVAPALRAFSLGPA